MVALLLLWSLIVLSCIVGDSLVIGRFIIDIDSLSLWFIFELGRVAGLSRHLRVEVLVVVRVLLVRPLLLVMLSELELLLHHGHHLLEALLKWGGGSLAELVLLAHHHRVELLHLLEDERVHHEWVKAHHVWIAAVWVLFVP